MLDPDRRKSYGVTSALLAWFIVLSYVASVVMSAAWSRWVSGESASAYDYAAHMSMGLVALVLVILRLLWWIKNQPPQAPRTMPEKAYALSRLTLLLMYLNVLQLALSGLLTGWATEQSGSVFGWLALPPATEDIALRLADAHAISWLVNYAIVAVYTLVNLYLGFRYKVGYRRMLPGVHV